MRKGQTKNLCRSHHPIAKAWSHLMDRCYNPKDPRFNTYGARGISVCAKWWVFNNFYLDMQPSWEEGLTIDRIDNDGDYCPENCRWISAIDNTRRRTNSKLNKEQAAEIRKRFSSCMLAQKQLAKEFGISDRMVRYIASGDHWHE